MAINYLVDSDVIITYRVRNILKNSNSLMHREVSVVQGKRQRTGYRGIQDEVKEKRENIGFLQNIEQPVSIFY